LARQQARRVRACTPVPVLVTLVKSALCIFFT
jgi:hypothetical protein